MKSPLFKNPHVPRVRLRVVLYQGVMGWQLQFRRRWRLGWKRGRIFHDGAEAEAHIQAFADGVVYLGVEP